MNYALITDGVVVNVIVLLPRNAAAFPNAVAIENLPVGIGDTYDGEHFYRDGERIYGPEEQIMLMTAELEAAYIEGVNIA